MSEDPPRRVLTDDEVVGLAQEAIQTARDETRRVDAEEAPKELQKPGITIDLGHKNITSLPEEVIDIIKDEIERLALSHNQLAQLPPRLSECNRLRYLNVRYNAMRELPPPVLQLFSLEILDISKNRIRVLPDEIANLTSLKVFAIQRNKIEKLPLCLGDIGSLQVLKLDGNPIIFPPPEICRIQENTPKPSNENEKDAVITSQVKRYLRQQANREKLRIESEGESSEGNVETPRPPRRMMSGRFPVKPSISGLDNFDSDSGIPPVPHNHFRGQSQQGNSGRRPVISPLLINNERNRSQSDGGGGSATIRAKRGGLVIKQPPDLGSVDEARMKLSDHSRNVSQASTTSGITTNGTATPSTTSSYQSEGVSQRTLLNRPLSDLLEHKRRSRAPDVVVEAAKTVLYALHQLHGPVLRLLQKTRFSRSDNGPERGMNLQRRVRDSTVLIRSLGVHLQKFDTLAEEDDDDATKLSAIIRDDLIRCLHLYWMMFVSIFESVKEINRDADPRLVRTLLVLVQGSTSEIRNACSVLGVDFEPTPTGPTPKYSGSTLATNLSFSNGPSAPLPAVPQNRKGRYNGNAYQPSVPETPISAQPEVLINGSYESPQSTIHGANAVTPRSGESFATLSNRHNGYPSEQEFEEEARFEKIFLKLKTATAQVNKGLPPCRHYFQTTKRFPSDSYNDSYQGRSQVLVDLVHKSDDIIACSNDLSQRLSNIKLRDTAARNQQDFWQHSTNFCKLWSEFATIVIEAASARIVSSEIRKNLKPIHKAFKDVSVEINSSPWSHLALQFQSNSHLIPPLPSSINTFSTTNNSNFPPPSRPGTSLSMAPTHTPSGSIPNPINTSIASMNGANAQNGLGASLATPVPATPLSAALGAAAQATIPKHPSHGSSSSSQSGSSSIPTMPMQAGFPGTSVVFERADRLLSNTQRRI